ncbi:MAG: hypothetical protein ACTTIC_06135 [Helicobacteraceae bacterium]
MNLLKKGSLTALGLSLLVFGVASCGGGGSSGSSNSGQKGQDKKDPTISIFASGIMQQNNEQRAVYWKDGEKHDLSQSNSEARSITVKDGKAYVAGVVKDGEGGNATPHATYWLDGKETKLSTERSEAFSIGLLDNDVYVAGTITSKNGAPATQTTKPTYWHNQDLFTLNNDGGATSVDFSGKDVYVGGYSTVYNEGKQTGIKVASYWINDFKKEHNVTNKDGASEAKINSLKVKDGTVYACGYKSNDDGSSAIYWKGTEETVLSSDSAEAYSIFLDGNDVYVAGSTKEKQDTLEAVDVATYWKNGKEHNLSKNALASSIFVFNGDVYVGGATYEIKKVNDMQDVKYIPTYWKNGEKHTFKEINASVTSIFVTKNK